MSRRHTELSRGYFVAEQALRGARRIEIREQKFLEHVLTIVERGGKCLMPVFALGRAQEILLILNEHWAQNPQKLKKIPIYYQGNLA